MKNPGIRKSLLTFYSLIPKVFLYVKFARVRLLSPCPGLYVRKYQTQED